MKGTVLEGYIIKPADLQSLRKVGEGASGTVYEATLWNGRKGQTVAAKQLNVARGGAQGGDIAGFNASFLRECELLCQVSHPNVVAFFGISYEEKASNHLVLVTEFCARTLRNIVFPPPHPVEAPPPPQMSIHKVLHMAHGIASGMAYLHSMKVVHRDIKFDNILVDDAGNCKICDFGLSRLMHSNRLNTMTVMTGQVGTPAFLAPVLFPSSAHVLRHVFIYAPSPPCHHLHVITTTSSLPRRHRHVITTSYVLTATPSTSFVSHVHSPSTFALH